jgi:hypothetical protein
MIVPRNSPKTTQRSRGGRRLRWALWMLAGAAALGVACSDDDAEDAGQCIGGDGAVAGTNDNHCIDDNGTQIANTIGVCATGAGEEEEEEEHEEGEEEEEHSILFGRAADDDNCKYHVRFENTCVALNEPVTFTLSLTRLFDDTAGSGTVPSNLEIFMADDVTHISPSNNITATEGPQGTYRIGPVVFDSSGRWVIRFHYFDNCSELPPDSPHSHVAFYIDVP